MFTEEYIPHEQMEYKKVNYYKVFVATIPPFLCTFSDRIDV
ncbi:hypothetical protein BAC_5607 [Bacillus anthracis str. A0488]|nr:hypothetical protein BAA_5627 [Bacillus anthracis str. A0248]AFH86727.1 Hypothetical Protein H9401_5343 [Bacillus anthracis str. H9401]EDR18481.1 hypothetical protein BAC_5607 [Bacillus anthracis str. A0488]EDR87027.1 hypothetical protein BAQ_5625 [Bacillus anthracis str. A0193]EDS95916.1 hypothetical protein BAK_5692 [Bacillus anthracis str. A0389]EDT67659.1 hypothetical protein BAO_5593 [Bacillus anthracis str. A0174]EDV13746.1 hypothetical protein BATI_5424 [Bacillus anthracis str. Tsia